MGELKYKSIFSLYTGYTATISQHNGGDSKVEKGLETEGCRGNQCYPKWVESRDRFHTPPFENFPRQKL